MNSWKENVSIGIAFIALAGFLLFWLNQEYEQEIENQYIAASLDEATKIIQDQDKSLGELIEELKRVNEEGHIEVQVAVRDDQDQQTLPDSPTSPEDRSKLVIRHIDEGKYWSEPIHDPGDSIIYGESLMSDSLTAIKDVKRIIKTDYTASMDVDHSEALIGIWPQILFAIILYGLLLGSMILMKRSHRLAQSLMVDRNNLISNLTHELKTPVSTVSVALEAIQNFNIHQDKEKSSTYISIARKELDRLSESIDMVMDLSALDDEEAQLEMQEVDLLEICNEVTEIMTPRLEQRGTSLDVSGPHTMIHGSHEHLRNVLVNLIDNAIKYGEESGMIKVEIASSPQFASLVVEDNGPGIPEEHQEKVFNRFYRIQDGNKHNVKGNGLGLSYVKETILAHGGSVSLSSKIGKGTRIVIKLPIKR